jgi:hypothetical protein
MFYESTFRENWAMVLSIWAVSHRHTSRKCCIENSQWPFPIPLITHKSKGYVGWHTKWYAIWFSINYSTMHWMLFCNMVTLNSRPWSLVLALPEGASVALLLLMHEFTQDGWQRKPMCRTTHKNNVVLYWNKKCCGHTEATSCPFSNIMSAFIQKHS